MKSLLVRNGRLMDPATGRDEIADLLIFDGAIACVGKNLDELPGVFERIVAT